MVHTIDSLLSKILSDGKTSYDLDKITEAYKIAENAHAGQKRSSGDPFISHPIAVACILLEYNMDTDTIVAAILHDVVEDTGITLSLLEKKFGGDVALLVDGVTKMGQVPLTTKEEQHAENIRKILIFMAKDIRVILIKLADRLHNMRTLDFRPIAKQLDTSFETMSFYAPIAHRLGMNNIKEEMEDISLRFLDPYAFDSVEEQVNLRKEQRDCFIDRITDTIMERINNIKPDPIIEGRVKSTYSIYKKIFVDGKNFEEIYDIYAVRIIVQSVIECYNILGIIHDLFHPIPFRFKDYIATPKNNRYQSLHTTVLCKEGIPFEVQIRTLDMHNTAEYGVAAHWKYKAGIKGKLKSAGENKLEWIRHILEQQQEADDVQQITEAIKTDLAPYDVYVFTPKGDVITLPLGATVIDFAYMIHSEVGNKMTGAKVGGRIVNFEYTLETGDIVEIMTTNSPAYAPNRNWLDVVKTNQAKVKIRAWFRRERRSENISHGKENLERELRRNNVPHEDELLSQAATELRYDATDDFLAAIGYGGVPLTRAVQKIKDLYLAKHDSKSPAEPITDLSEIIAKKQSKGVVVEGIDNCLVRFAQCCTPLPGDDIIGFITRGYGVSVHKKDCSNVNTEQNLERWINVWWAHHGNIYYRAAIEVIAEDRTGLLADVTTVISANKLHISDFLGKKLKNGNVCIEASMEIANIEQLNSILTKLKKIQGVIMATRKET
ncbi:MAG: bifunctional (p)ppGpp synthetase/guanosine-3',5'-bis(diphosphate) 3'-pyrophosphohydrolase [Oscillospiraceae bacterium]|nr:bifunctional (p)ppGpp synthetase/guanosine-3',5'-bis(diphosphate) 3'-pyrophosphohydrolase [Oscillospiraceae bacterium]